MYRKTNLELLLLGLFFFVLFAGATYASTEEDFLLPDQAFQLSAESLEPDSVLLRWKIAEGYYLYKSKFKFSSEDPGVTLSAVDFPPAEIKDDEFFGRTEIYRGPLEIPLPVQSSNSQARELELTAVYQGCADAGLCYPPQIRTLKVALAAVNETPQPASSSKEPLAALSKLGLSLGLDQENEIPLPEEAYQFSASVDQGDRLMLHWEIAEGTYLYQDKLDIRLLEGEGVTLGEFQLPKGKLKRDTVKPDGTFGDLEVYQQHIDLEIPLLRSSTAATEFTLQVSYQGCAEAGVCYPPIKQTRRFALAEMLPTVLASTLTAPDDTVRVKPSVLPQAAQTGTKQPETAPPISEQDRIAATLAGGNFWFIVLTFFGFGLLLSLTPCVFPMIPILSGIIAGQGPHVTTGRAFRLSLIYVLAMSLTYTLAGVLAGIFGHNLQAAFQNPWILSFFALVFVLLALSMFGFYDLQIPSKWQSRLADSSNKQTTGSYTGVAVMGLLSALIVGPCVAPPLAGALIYIGQSGDATLGGIGLFAMAMGMGVPLLLIGTSAGKLLPRAGSWMDTVKAVFGVGMLAVAIIMLERIVPPAVAMVLWGALLIISAIYMGALQQLSIEASGWQRLWRGVGVVFLAYGVLMLVGAAAGGKDTVQPLRGVLPGGGGGSSAGALTAELHFKRIKTIADLEREVAAASRTGKPVMLDFYADWCVTCKEMERYTFSDPTVIKALEGFVLLQADVTADDADDRALLQGHFAMPGPPSIMFYDRTGQEQRPFRLVGFMAANDFVAHIRRFQQ